MALLKKFAVLDSFRLLAAFLIIAIHTSPLSSFNSTADFVLTRIIARVAVPFFLIATGYFLFSRVQKNGRTYLWAFCKRISLIYTAAILLYLPLNIYAGYFSEPKLCLRLAKDILINGTFYHLWYLPALLTGVLLVYWVRQKAGIHTALLVSAVLYIIGLFGDSYYGIAAHSTVIESFYRLLFSVSDYTRNGLFFAPLFIAGGAWLYEHPVKLSLKINIGGLFISSALLLTEGLALHRFAVQRHDSMYIMLPFCMVFLFSILLQTSKGNKKTLRTAAMLVYLIHPWIIVLVRGLAKAIQLQNLFIANSGAHFLAVSSLSFTAAWSLLFIGAKIKLPKPTAYSRAWVEIDIGALIHNAKVLQALLPKQCRLMAVVKANAYGHGDVEVCKALNKAKIRSFAVATLQEGIHLRRCGIQGDILILGYTNPRDAACLARYRLSQNIVDTAYAAALNTYGKKIKVQLEVDTGIHRLGLDFSKLSDIESIFHYNNLCVEGVFSHLSVSDSLTETDIAYTQQQIKRYFETIAYFQAKGYRTGKLHIQASYGILNYPDLPCDCARAGIALYGILSSNNAVLDNADLRPVLSLKARVAVVKQIAAGESVSYGRNFIAASPMKIAVVTIGYGDGVPRNLSDTDAYVLVRSQKAPVIGRICMDQLVIDVTAIDNVEPNCIVTIIGTDGIEQIRCEDLAEKCSTITNEILSQLGSRLNYKYLNK